MLTYINDMYESYNKIQALISRDTKINKKYTSLYYIITLLHYYIITLLHYYIIKLFSHESFCYRCHYNRIN